MSLELPDLPQEVFGAGISWDNQRSVLYVCGGATWTQAYSNCYSLDLRWNYLYFKATFNTSDRSRAMIKSWTKLVKWMKRVPLVSCLGFQILEISQNFFILEDWTHHTMQEHQLNFMMMIQILGSFTENFHWMKASDFQKALIMVVLQWKITLFIQLN